MVAIIEDDVDTDVNLLDVVVVETEQDDALWILAWHWEV